MTLPSPTRFRAAAFATLARVGFLALALAGFGVGEALATRASTADVAPGAVTDMPGDPGS